MAKELYSNLDTTFLAAPVASADTTISVVSATPFPATGNFTIRIDSEFLLVTGVAGTTLTVSRGQEGTAAASHSQGAFVLGVVTDGSLRRLVRQGHNGTNVAVRREMNFLDGMGLSYTFADDPTNDKVDIRLDAIGPTLVVSPPPTAGWTVVGSASGTFSATQDARGTYNLYDSGPTGAQERVCMVLQAAQATPYSIAVCLIPTLFPAQPQNTGLCFYEQSTGKIHSLCYSSKDSNQIDLFIYRWTNPTTYDAIDFGQGTDSVFVRFLKVRDDGTNLTFYFSGDGTHWLQAFQCARTTFMAGGPSHVGIHLNATAANYGAAAQLVHWQQGT